MNTSYLLIILISNTLTNTNIGAQTFELNSAKDCIEMREFATNEFRTKLPKEITGTAACFKNLGGASSNI